MDSEAAGTTSTNLMDLVTGPGLCNLHSNRHEPDPEMSDIRAAMIVLMFTEEICIRDGNVVQYYWHLNKMCVTDYVKARKRQWQSKRKLYLTAGGLQFSGRQFIYMHG